MIERLFYRVGNDQNEGLWYNRDGSFSGLIHKLDHITNHHLQMPFEEELVGYLSVADSLEHLYEWFTKSDILSLQINGYRILEYKSNDYKFYKFYRHNVINEKTAILTNKIILI